MEKTEQKQFYCYSIQLRNFLKLQGINYDSRGRHKKTGNQFWIYHNSLALDKALDNWNIYKNTFWKER